MCRVRVSDRWCATIRVVGAGCGVVWVVDVPSVALLVALTGDVCVWIFAGIFLGTDPDSSIAVPEVW